MNLAQKQLLQKKAKALIKFTNTLFQDAEDFGVNEGGIHEGLWQIKGEAEKLLTAINKKKPTGV